MIPSGGRTVHYTLTEQDAAQINKRRADSRNKNAAGVTLASQELGAVIHVGNGVQAGEVYPLVITRVWGDQEGSTVNGQVLLDGNDTFWARAAPKAKAKAKAKAKDFGQYRRESDDLKRSLRSSLSFRPGRTTMPW